VETLWFLVVVYVVFVMLVRSQQKAKRARQGGQAPGPAQPESRRARLEELQRVLRGETPPSDEVLRLANRFGVSLPAPPVAGPATDSAEPVFDYDTETIREAEARERAAETPAFLPRGIAPGVPRGGQLRAPPATGVAPRLQSRIVQRVVPPPGAEPEVTAAEPGTTTPGAPAAAARVARLARGGLRGAFVLSELLGPPRGQA
jgi:hypothetical protein